MLDQNGEKVMNPKEVSRFKALCLALQDPMKYNMTKIESEHLDLVDKLL